MKAAPSRRRAARRLALLAALVGLALAGPAQPAHADAATPTNYRSRVLQVEPAAEGVILEVVGGDAFLRARVEPGHTLTVFGYREDNPEPYLRIQADGTVQANRNSPAFYLNQDRYAAVEVPAHASPEADPDWTTVATGGSYAWHDHRIHWMSPQLPRTITPDDGQQTVLDWQIPLHIDGTPAMVRGDLLWMPARTPLTEAAAGLLLAAGMAAAARRTQRLNAGAAAAGAAALTAVAAGQAAAQPGDLTAHLLELAVPATALTAALAGLALPRPDLAEIATLAAATLTGLWALLRLSTLWLPVLPTTLPETTARLLLAAGLGLAAGVLAAAALRRLRPTPPPTSPTAASA